MENEISQPRRRRAKNSITPTRVGVKKIAESLKKEIFKRHFDRRMLLNIPQEILDAHPDKHFVWVNMPKLQQNGFYHPEGYRMLQADDPVVGKQKKNVADKLVNHFNHAADGFIHRNEMVLAWIPQKEYDERMFEEQVVRGNVNLEDLIISNPSLPSEFLPHAECTKDEMPFAVKKQQNNEEVDNG